MTGAASGLGLCMTKQLILLGHRVIAVCRTPESAIETAKALRGLGNRSTSETLWADLSSQQEVHRLATEILTGNPTIHALINNAGCVSSSRVITKDGIELQFAVNHLAPFLLTQLLAPALERSGQGRVVNVSSRAHGRGAVHWNDLMLEHGYTLSKAYNQSKLCALMATYGAAERLKDKSITVNAFHPGLVNTTIGEKHTDRVTRTLWQMMRLFGRSPEVSARTGVFLAVDEEVIGRTGLYFSGQGPTASSRASLNRDLIDRIWDVSLNLTHLQ